jgi:hypothetical protein
MRLASDCTVGPSPAAVCAEARDPKASITLAEATPRAIVAAAMARFVRLMTRKR